MKKESVRRDLIEHARMMPCWVLLGNTEKQREKAVISFWLAYMLHNISNVMAPAFKEK